MVRGRSMTMEKRGTVRGDAVDEWIIQSKNEESSLRGAAICVAVPVGFRDRALLLLLLLRGSMYSTCTGES